MLEADVTLHDLRMYVELALDMLDVEATVIEAEVCASWCEQHTVPIQYDATHPVDSLQPARTSSTGGIGILLVLDDPHGRRIGFGSEGGELSQESIVLALERAKANALPDPYFHGLPDPLPAASALPAFYDQQVLDLHPDDLYRLGLEALEGALSTLQEAGYINALKVYGPVCSRAEHLVLGTTRGLLTAETTTGLWAAILCRLLQESSQGTGSSLATHLAAFAPQDAGVQAARQALRMRNSVLLPAGDYPVIFGPQAVASLVQELLIPALSLDTVAAGTSPFATRLGQQVASTLLTMTDEGRRPGLLGSRAVTGEGLPTTTTTLIQQGQLTGFLADTYHAHKLAPRLGLLPAANGMRFALGQESFAMRPGIFPTNVVLTSSQPEPLEALLASLTDGVYIGGLWHTTPVGGLQTGACTSTVVGPAFRIRHGALAEPIRPGTLSLQENVLDLLSRITGLSATQQAVACATRQSLVLAPEMRCSHVHLL